jgi:hypothetical protein
MSSDADKGWWRQEHGASCAADNGQATALQPTFAEEKRVDGHGGEHYTRKGCDALGPGNLQLIAKRKRQKQTVRAMLRGLMPTHPHGTAAVQLRSTGAGGCVRL